MKIKKAFTLIEMLIVIVIIGILAAALIPRLQSVQGRARDTKRKADLSQLFNGILIYYEDNGSYPLPRDSVTDCSATITGNAACQASSLNNTTTTGWISQLLPNYLTSLPVDPVNTAASATPSRGPWYNGNYIYSYTTPYSRAAFSLYAPLENGNDADRCETKGYKINVNTMAVTNYLCTAFYTSVSPSNSDTGAIMKMFVRSHPLP